jgi:hypothetical protein
MKGRLLYVILAFAVYIFFHCFNANQILHSTHQYTRLERAFKAERNINNELKVDHDDLISGRNISSLVPEEMSKYITKEKAGNVIYIQEKEQQKASELYSIIDLFTPKAEAVTTVIPD